MTPAPLVEASGNQPLAALVAASLRFGDLPFHGHGVDGSAWRGRGETEICHCFTKAEASCLQLSLGAE